MDRFCHNCGRTAEHNRIYRIGFCDKCKDNLRHVKSDYCRCRACAIECDMCHKKHNPLNDCDESEYGLVG
jgi:hypothetical protein